jgi:hypothetical protein
MSKLFAPEEELLFQSPQEQIEAMDRAISKQGKIEAILNSVEKMMADYMRNLDQHTPGAKLDQGKVRLGLVMGGFSRALIEVGKVGTFGARKYTDNGWVDVPDGEARYTDAMLRHLLADLGGESVDEESGLLHAAHAAWNALAVLDLKLRELEIP